MITIRAGIDETENRKTVEKINEPQKCWFSEKCDKMDRSGEKEKRTSCQY